MTSLSGKDEETYLYRMAGIYIHIPFCKRKCVYCDFYSTAGFDTYSSAYLDAAVREMGASMDYLQGERIETLYFGGGTPSLYSPKEVGRLIGAVSEIFSADNLSEVTLEANPEDISQEYLTALKNTGIDRLSIGIQSFDDSLLTFMKRRHDGRKAMESVKLARKAGFENISIDLIYGIPGLTRELWEQTLERAISFRPEHISAYHLTFEPSTTLGRWEAAGKISEVPHEESQMHFEAVHRVLSDAGYEHYEVSNFALPGRRSRHNSSYWTGAKYLGIGPGAHSFNGAERRWCGMTVGDYVTEEKHLYGSEKLTQDDIYNELVMTSLRCADGLHPDTVTSKAGKGYTGYFIRAAGELTARGLLRTDGHKFFIHPSDFLISDSVISELFIPA